MIGMMMTTNPETQTPSMAQTQPLPDLHRDLAPRGLSIRGRLLAGMIALTGLALLVAGAVDYVLSRAEINERVDATMVRVVEEFRLLADTGVDPQTGEPYATTKEILYSAMQHTLPEESQGMVGLVNGEVEWNASSAVPLRLEADQQLIDWATETNAEDALLETVTTDQRTYRAMLVPVTLTSDDAQGVFLLAHDYSSEIRSLNTHMATLAGIGLAVILVAGVIAWLLVGRMLVPVRRLRDTAQQISESQLSTRIEVSGRDEFAELTVTVNEMLDRLQNAMESQRQLLDDVGHELRTPVTIIRGHLELMDSSDPEDVEQSKEIALDELNRMSLLINDLVTLATANRADFLSSQPTEIGPLLDDILDKARALGPQKWRLGQRVEATVELDGARITQAMLQLCANAVKFSEPDTRIDLGASVQRTTREGSLLRFWVRDNGVGIENADLEKIFTRFGRAGQQSRTQGSGLGLNIVSAIAAAHGGVVWVQSVPGGGSTFYIDIPLTAGVEEL